MSETAPKPERELTPPEYKLFARGSRLARLVEKGAPLVILQKEVELINRGLAELERERLNPTIN